MKAFVGFPVVVVGVIYAGASEHPALINKVYDALSDCSVVDVTMFPQGGGDPVFMRQIRVYDSQEAALKGSGPARTAYWPML